MIIEINEAVKIKPPCIGSDFRRTWQPCHVPYRISMKKNVNLTKIESYPAKKR